MNDILKHKKYLILKCNNKVLLSNKCIVNVHKRLSKTSTFSKPKLLNNNVSATN